MTKKKVQTVRLKTHFGQPVIILTGFIWITLSQKLPNPACNNSVMIPRAEILCRNMCSPTATIELTLAAKSILKLTKWHHPHFLLWFQPNGLYTNIHLYEKGNQSCESLLAGRKNKEIIFIFSSVLPSTHTGTPDRCLNETVMHLTTSGDSCIYTDIDHKPAKTHNMQM